MWNVCLPGLSDRHWCAGLLNWCGRAAQKGTGNASLWALVNVASPMCYTALPAWKICPHTEIMSKPIIRRAASIRSGVLLSPRLQLAAQKSRGATGGMVGCSMYMPNSPGCCWQ
jgi:hypothetical protein